MAHRPSAYGEKVDIYSLAIIFFELYRPFATAMERAEAIDALKQGIFPDGFVERYPKEVRHPSSEEDVRHVRGDTKSSYINSQR